MYHAPTEVWTSGGGFRKGLGLGVVDGVFCLSRKSCKVQVMQSLTPAKHELWMFCRVPQSPIRDPGFQSSTSIYAVNRCCWYRPIDYRTTFRHGQYLLSKVINIRQGLSYCSRRLDYTPPLNNWMTTSFRCRKTKTIDIDHRS